MFAPIFRIRYILRHFSTFFRAEDRRKDTNAPPHPTSCHIAAHYCYRAANNPVTPKTKAFSAVFTVLDANQSPFEHNTVTAVTSTTTIRQRIRQKSRFTRFSNASTQHREENHLRKVALWHFRKKRPIYSKIPVISTFIIHLFLKTVENENSILQHF